MLTKCVQIRLENEKKIHNLQSGFRKDHLCITSLRMSIKLHVLILNLMERKQKKLSILQHVPNFFMLQEAIILPLHTGATIVHDVTCYLYGFLPPCYSSWKGYNWSLHFNGQCSSTSGCVEYSSSAIKCHSCSG